MIKQSAKALSSKQISDAIVLGMLEKKATDIVLIDLRKVKHAVADFFVICSGNSDTQIDAIADSVEDELIKNSKTKPWKKEGFENKEWILIDYVDVVAHIFNKEKRVFYALEELWADAIVTQVEQN